MDERDQEMLQRFERDFRPVIAFGAFFAAAYAVLALTSGLSTGDWSP